MNLLTFSRPRRSGFYFCALMAVLCLLAVMAQADPPSAELTKILPADFGSFHRATPIRTVTTLVKDDILHPEYFPASLDPKAPPVFIGGEAEYASQTGDKFLIEVVRFQTDSEAFSLLTLTARKASGGSPSPEIKLGDVGTANVSASRGVSFFRGTTFARVTSTEGNSKAADELARLLAATLEKGEDEVPVLVKHLPEWLNAKARTS